MPGAIVSSIIAKSSSAAWPGYCEGAPCQVVSTTSPSRTVTIRGPNASSSHSQLRDSA